MKTISNRMDRAKILEYLGRFSSVAWAAARLVHDHAHGDGPRCPTNKPTPNTALQRLIIKTMLNIYV